MRGITLGFLLAFVVASRAAPEAPAPAARDNFYAWANRDWLAKTEIAADRSRADNFTQLEDTVLNQLHSLFDSLNSAKTRTREQEKLVRLYNSFVDMEQRDARGLAPIAGELGKISALTNHLEVAQLCAYFQTIGIASPVIVAPQADFKNSTMTIGFVAQAGLGIERDYYLGGDEDSLNQQKRYRAFLAKLFALAAFEEPDAIAGRVLDFERKLAAIQWSRVENRDMQKIYNPLSGAEFIQQSTNFHGGEMLAVLGVSPDAALNVMQPSYIDAYGSLFAGTSIATWQDYLRARLLTTYSGLLTSQFKAASVQYDKDRGLIQEEEPLWRQGIEFVSAMANLMVGRAYVEKYYDEATKDSVSHLVLSIRDEYRSAIEHAAWMSDETKKKAIEKLDTMRFKIGYPDKWRDYSGLEIRGTDLADNFRRAMQFEHVRNMAKIGKPVDRNEWEHSPHEINAFYDSTKNEFVLLAAILQEPFYSKDAGAAAQYGGLGFVVGHEIGHGFDDQGCQFDGDGNMRNWWTGADAKAYGEKQQRLIRQADAYEILPGTFLKGAQEIGEIMGDLGGAQIALQAYMKTPEASDQDFFVHLAQTWRSKWRDEFLKMVIQSDNHPPSEFRSNGIVRQFDAFHVAFGVKPGDKMYLAPEERVLLW